MRATAKTAVVLGLLVSMAASGSANENYQVVDNDIVVLGHALTTAEQLPDLSCEECAGAHNVTVVRSPGADWVLVVSDVHLSNFDAWILDEHEGSPPIRIAEHRCGRHLSKSQWHGNNIVELTFDGMGLRCTLLTDARNPTEVLGIDGLLHFDADRDVYVRYEWNVSPGAREIEVGPVFGGNGPIERFPIALDNPNVPDSLGEIVSVEIDGSELTVVYDTQARGIVSDTFRPQILAVE